MKNFSEMGVQEMNIQEMQKHVSGGWFQALVGIVSGIIAIGYAIDEFSHGMETELSDWQNEMNEKYGKTTN